MLVCQRSRLPGLAELDTVMFYILCLWATFSRVFSYGYELSCMLIFHYRCRHLLINGLSV